MTSTKRRTHAKPPPYLSPTETRRWKDLVTELHRLERGMEELDFMRQHYCRKEDFDLVLGSNMRLSRVAEEKLVAIETLSADRRAEKSAAT